MKNNAISEIGNKLQEVKFKGNIQTLHNVLRKMTGSIKQDTIKNYIRILHKDNYITFNKGIWEAYIEEQPQLDKKDEPIETIADFDKQTQAFKQAKPIKEKTGTELKKQKTDAKEQEKIRKKQQEEQRREVQRLISNQNHQSRNDKLSDLINQMDKKNVTIIWEDRTTYYVVCKDCYELQTGNKWISNQNNKKLRAHAGLLQQAINTKYCHMCGIEIQQ